MVFRREGSIKKQWLKTRDQPLFWGADLIKYFLNTSNIKFYRQMHS